MLHTRTSRPPPAHYRITPASELENAAAIELFDYWQALRRGREMPAIEDVDPRDIVPLLPDIAIVDVIDGGRDGRVRLFGTRLVSIYGKDLTGLKLSEIEEGGNRALEALAAVLETRAPARIRAEKFSVPERDFQASESLYLPLASADGSILRLLFILVLMPQ